MFRTAFLGTTVSISLVAAVEWFWFVADAVFLVSIISCSNSVGGRVIFAGGRMSSKDGSLGNGELEKCVMSLKCVRGGVLET